MAGSTSPFPTNQILNVKPEALSRIHSVKESSTDPSLIFQPTCLIAAVTSDIEAGVIQAQLQHADPGGGPPNHWFVPKSALSQVLQWAHSSPLTCHPGVSRTLGYLRRRFWWPTMEADTLFCLCSKQDLNPALCKFTTPATHTQPSLVPHSSGLLHWTSSILG